ncbi:MAG: histidine kinase [Gammaproteobacteria bacterium]|nr:histidine kinase [Gammaproteobacteria bacterium]
MKVGTEENHGAAVPALLPDFCDARVIFSVVLMVQIVALVVALVPIASRDFWLELAMVSFFAHWVAVSSLVILCLLKRVLARLAGGPAALVTGAVVIVVTAVVSEGALQALELLVLPPFDRPGRMDFMGRNVAIAAIVYAAVLRYFYVRHQWRRNVELGSQARVAALQARIRPHFLFNSMNTIASLTRSRPAVAEQVVEDLAALFRVTLKEGDTPATLAQELEVCRRYLAIEAQRLGERLRVAWDIGEGVEAARLPPLTLQPLVENAVYHGVEPSIGGGEVRIRVRRDGPWLDVEVSNPLPQAGQVAPRAGNRMAQANVAERLAAFFDAAVTFETAAGPDLYRLHMRLPYRETPP